MEENKKHPSQIIHGFLMADDRKQKEDVPILTHPLQSTCSLCANDLAVFESQEQELKAQYLKYKYEQKRYSVS